MSAAEDFPKLAEFAAPHTDRLDLMARMVPVMPRDREEFRAALAEIDWLRNSLGELLARLATVASPDEWKRPI